MMFHNSSRVVLRSMLIIVAMNIFAGICWCEENLAITLIAKRIAQDPTTLQLYKELATSHGRAVEYAKHIAASLTPGFDMESAVKSLQEYARLAVGEAKINEAMISEIWLDDKCPIQLKGWAGLYWAIKSSNPEIARRALIATPDLAEAFLLGKSEVFSKCINQMIALGYAERYLGEKNGASAAMGSTLGVLIKASYLQDGGNLIRAEIARNAEYYSGAAGSVGGNANEIVFKNLSQEDKSMFLYMKTSADNGFNIDTLNIGTAEKRESAKFIKDETMKVLSQIEK